MLAHLSTERLAKVKANEAISKYTQLASLLIPTSSESQPSSPIWLLNTPGERSSSSASPPNRKYLGLSPRSMSYLVHLDAEKPDGFTTTQVRKTSTSTACIPLEPCGSTDTRNSQSSFLTNSTMISDSPSSTNSWEDTEIESTARVPPSGSLASRWSYSPLTRPISPNSGRTPILQSLPGSSVGSKRVVAESSTSGTRILSDCPACPTLGLPGPCPFLGVQHRHIPQYPKYQLPPYQT